MADTGLLPKYAIEEMKATRKRMEEEIAYMNRLEILSVTAIGAVLLIIFQYKISDPIVAAAIMGVAFAIGFYGLFRYIAHDKILDRHNRYLHTLESMVKSENENFVGLATFWNDDTRSTWGKPVRYVFWGLVVAIVLGMIIAVLSCPSLLSEAVRAKT